MSKQSLNVAIVGTGIFATDTHLPTLQKISSINPYAAYNRTKSKAEAFAEKANIEKSNVVDSLDAIFENDKVDFVDALLPVQNNLDIVKLAIKHNKPIVIEKPIAANLQQAKEIVKLSEESDLPIGVLENWSFKKAISVIKNDVLPKIGNVVSFTYESTGAWNDNNKYLNTSWRQKPEHIGGFLSDGGVHQLALLTGVLGEVESVSALTRQLRKESGTDDILYSTFQLKENNIIGTFNYGSAFGAKEKSTKFTILGDNGSLVYDFSPSLSKPKITYQTGSSSQQASDPVTIEIDEVDTFQEEFKNFTESVIAKDKNLILVRPAKAFHHLAIIDAALKSSSQKGSSVTVENP